MTKKSKKEKIARVNAQVVIEAISKRADKIFRSLATIPSITTQEDFARAGDLIKTLKSFAAMAKEEENKIASPLKQALAATAEHFKPFYNKVAAIETNYKALMLGYVEDSKKKLKDLDEKVESGKLKNISKYVEQASSLAVESTDSASIRKVWKAEIIDLKKVPREFLVPDMQKITEHLRAKGASIPGVEWKQVDTIAI